MRPYWPHYAGDEDTRRKPAYHNGTAWGWMFPSFCEARFKRYGKLDVPPLVLAGRRCRPSHPARLCRASAGNSDGDYPHALRGCDAQAWSVSEALRVLRLLEADS